MPTDVPKVRIELFVAAGRKLVSIIGSQQARVKCFWKREWPSARRRPWQSGRIHSGALVRDHAGSRLLVLPPRHMNRKGC